MSKKSFGVAIFISGLLFAILSFFLVPDSTPKNTIPKNVVKATKADLKRDVITTNAADPTDPAQKSTIQASIAKSTQEPAKTESKSLAILRGRVLAPDGSGMEDARIYCNHYTRDKNNEVVVSYKNSQRVKSNVKGEYSLKLQPGRYRIAAGTRGPYRSTKDYFIEVKAGEEQLTDLQLRVYLTLQISVKDTNGAPIPGVELWLQPENLPGSVRGPELTTDANGLVLFKELSDERHNLLIKHPQFAQRFIKIELKEDIINSERSFVLEKGLILSGTLVSSKTQKPLLKASMTLQKMNGSIFHTRYECDPDGIFKFTSLSPGRYELTGRADNYDNKTIYLDVPKGSSDINFGTFPLNKLLDLTITVIDSAGRALSGVAVRQLDFGLCPFSVIEDAAEDGIDSLFLFRAIGRDLSDSKGQVQFKEFAPGTHNFVLTKKDAIRNYCDAQVVSETNNHLTLRFTTKSGVIKGQFYDKNGQAIKDKAIALIRDGYQAIVEGCKTGEDGRFEFSNLAPGRYKILEVGSATKEDLESKDNWLTLDDGAVLIQNVLE
ncbi:MAG: hypothetical protein P1V97_01475 [Planctomycetota bacterium]|nr:hypothetical protein [Planctomycetota bacterium]